jgi:ABC-2 type transport system permease protein
VCGKLVDCVKYLGLPRPAVATSIDPLSYGIDGLRGAFIGLSHFGLATDAAVLALIGSCFLGLGAWAFSRIQI